ncbi:MAG TPA: hypothetical protein VHP11_11985 [Tepidisphaeraceae bacterium]|nr:hypothetical protein [Tepidisphaeraceae bacterium]
MVKFRKPRKSDQHNPTQSVSHPPMAPRPIECLESRRLLSTYYVDAKTGDDSWTGTSLATPWRTLQSALDRTASGDVITLRAYADAEYTDNLDNFDVYTPNLTIRTYAGDLPARAIISAVNNLNNEESTLVVTSEAANTKLYDLEIKGGMSMP